MKNLLPKLLITIATLFYGIVPIFADLSESHLLNHGWMPHAKLHLAWLLSTNSLLALLSLYLLWIKRTVVMAGVLGLCVMSGFWIAAIFRNVYGGMFVDPDMEASEILGLHPNVFAFIFVTTFLISGIILEMRSRPAA